MAFVFADVASLSPRAVLDAWEADLGPRHLRAMGDVAMLDTVQRRVERHEDLFLRALDAAWGPIAREHTLATEVATIAALRAGFTPAGVAQLRRLREEATS